MTTIAIINFGIKRREEVSRFTSIKKSKPDLWEEILLYCPVNPHNSNNINYIVCGQRTGEDEYDEYMGGTVPATHWAYYPSIPR